MFRFEGLEIWRRAMEFSCEMMEVAEELDRIRKYKIAEQLRNCALSISNNITEGSGSASKRDFRLFLNYAHRSAFETANMLMLCHRKTWITQTSAQKNLKEVEEIAKMIIGFSRSL